jgi:23S rRNA (cytidine1920-2'-O)/16S rRNA (cytidine1409-2'-O)-methyltransferase
MSAARIRLDRLLVDRGLCESRTRAQALVMSGRVLVDGVPVTKSGTAVRSEAEVTLRGEDHGFVSRGGVKLAGALDRFAADGLEVAGRVAMDVGASTGGFSDCLLQRGIARVHAIDVGYGQLAWRVASDPRVRVHDRCNIRTMDPAALDEAVDLVVIDCSFVALAKVLPAVPAFLTRGGERVAEVVALVKPQFELDPGRIGKGGIVRAEADRAEAVARAAAAAVDLGFVERGRCVSPIAGRQGNEEWFLWLAWRPGGMLPA